MNSTILMLVCAPCAAVLAIAWILAALNEKGVNPFYEIFGRYRKQSVLGLLLIPILVLKAISFGSNKTPTNDAPSDVSSPTNAPSLMMVWPGPLTPDPRFESGFSSNELALGYAPWRTGTNEVWDFGPVPEAHVVEAWRLRGAAEDWAVCATTNLGPVVMTTDGRLVTTNGVFTAYDGLLALVPEANWGLLGTNAPSRAWWAETPWESTVFTWQNAFLGRDTNVPVSVQAEFTSEGDFIYRYDLSRADTNLTSELYYRIRPEDLTDDDRDGDGLSTFDEVMRYHSDPGLVDSDGDGLLDGDEVGNGTDPAVRSVPNAEILARVADSATNGLYEVSSTALNDAPLCTIKLWDGFAADWPAGRTNLVYERTLDLGAVDGWQCYFLSSRELEAGGWDLRGLELEWDDGCGFRGTATASPRDDSYALPLTNAVVTIRLRATGPKIRCPKPMYLVGYAPGLSFEGGRRIRDEHGAERVILLRAAETNQEIGVSVDRSRRPCRAPLYPHEREVPELSSVGARTKGAFTYDGDGEGGRIIATSPACLRLPKVAIEAPRTYRPRPLLKAARGGGDGGDDRWLVVLDPTVSYGGEHRFELVSSHAEGERMLYPEDSRCLWNTFWWLTFEGAYTCHCEPKVSAGEQADLLPFVTNTCHVANDQATGTVYVFEVPVWTGSSWHSWRNVGGDEGMALGGLTIDEVDSCEVCAGSCEDGLCDDGDDVSLNSVRMRISLGSPRRGQHSGFLYLSSEGPVAVSPASFRLRLRDDAAVTERTEGAVRSVACADNRGRDLLVAPAEGGVRITVTTHKTGALEDVWEVRNENGDTNVVRIIQRSRLDNVLRDETFVCTNGVWSRTDNVAGIRETLVRADGLDDPTDRTLRQTRMFADLAGNPLSCVRSEYAAVGCFSGARVRQTLRETSAGGVTNWTRAAYWNDPDNGDRHGLLRLMWGNCRPWVYHDYDARGFETLRVEQRNGSDVPTDFPTVVAGELLFTGGLADATVTVYEYEPLFGDDVHRDESEHPRRETRYVVRNGRATCVSRIWRRYTHVLADYPAVCEETWRASTSASDVSDPANAYSSITTYSHTEEGVPIALRGEVAEELSEDGVLSVHSVRAAGAVVRDEIRRSFGGNAFPTYEVVERDAVYGLEVRKATHLTDGDVLLDEEVSSYDEKNRLRSTVYSNGTSLTNAFSCCRKLWSVDREGRRTLRSARTGTDRLYCADEEVWHREVATNGLHKVTQHLFDGLGRETNTVVYAAAVPGEAVDFAASAGRRLTSETTAYPNGGDDVSVTVDARGLKTAFERREYEDRTETVESVFAAADAAEPDLVTLTTEWRNGARTTEKAWEGKWTRETEWEDYDSDGCAVRYEVTESSDCGMVTNRIVTSDFLGRTVREVTPNGTTETAYHGATERTDTTTLTAAEITRVTTVVYNERGEEVGSELDGVTNRTDEVYEMDSDGNWWKVTRSERSDGETADLSSERREQLTGRESDVISRRIEIDADGVVEETVERTGAAEGERVTVVSNAVTGVRTQTRRYGVVVETATSAETRQFASDAFGRQVGETRCVDGVNVLPCSETVYNAMGEVMTRRSYTNGTKTVTETYAYDTFGRRVSSVDALGNETVTRYDAVGNVVEQSGATWPVRYDYDTAGRRVSLSTTKDGRIWDVTRWTYDPATGKCIAKRYPDGSQVTYSLTPDGLPLETEKVSGAWSRNAYDAKRQLVGTESSDGAGDAAFAYDVFGKMTAASNGVARYAYARHRGGIVTNEWADLDGDVQIVRTVDEFGRLSGRGVSDQDLQAIAYDGQGRVAAVSSGAAVATYAYGAGGVDAGYTLALNGGATIERRVVRDAYRPEQIVAVSNFVNGAAVGGESYARDAKGRIVERVENVERVEQFGYDAVGQVVEVANYQLPSTNYQLTSYSYDLIGNIAGSESLAYTVDGEVTGLNGLTFGYDSASRLTTVATGDVTIATYAYDAFDRRVRKTTPEATTTYLYDGWNLVREEIAGTNGTTDVIEYYWGKDISGSLDTAGGIGGLLYLKRNGAVYVPLYDASGNVTAYVDAAGNVVVSFTYDAFGNCTVQSNNQNNRTIEQFSRFRYSTKYFDAETGLIYYGYRFYAPTTARWLTRDPLEEQGGLNLHCFCENDGVNKVDWLGQVPEPTQDGDGRRFWHKIAEMLSNEGYSLTALFIVKSFESEKNFKGALKFMPGSDLSKAIKESPEYKDIIDKTIRNLSNGRHVVKKEPASFPNATLVYARICDLKFSVKNAIVKFTDGTVCKQGFGIKGKPVGDRVFLNIKVSGKYKYDQDCLTVLNFADKAKEREKEKVMADFKEHYVGALRGFEWDALIKESR